MYAASPWAPSFGFFVVVSFVPAIAAADFDPTKTYHIKTVPVRTVEALLNTRIETPNMFAQEWVVVVPTAPELPGQNGVLHEILFDGRLSNAIVTTENSPLSRPIRAMRVAGFGDFHTLEFLSRYRVNLSRRTLEPGQAANVPDLPPVERQFYLRPTATIDFNQPTFSAWFRTSGLQRIRQESDLALAYRVFRRIAETGKYTPGGEQERHPSRTCITLSTDCGGFAMLYVAILRANGIPARTAWGRWAKSQVDKDGQFHVKSEFFDRAIGWVPVEITGAITSEGTAKNDFFGRDDGDFVTMHVDTDMNFNTIHFGKKDVGWRQGAAFWIKGSGTMDSQLVTETWTVSPIGPQPEGQN